MNAFLLKSILRQVFRPRHSGAYLIPPLTVLALLVLFIGPGVVLRPLLLTIGRPAMGHITKMDDRRRWVEVNFQYDPDLAPRFKTYLDAAAYARMDIFTKVRVRYFPGFPWLAALEDDFGYARTNAWWITLLLASSGGALAYRLYVVLFTPDRS